MRPLIESSEDVVHLSADRVGFENTARNTRFRQIHEDCPDVAIFNLKEYNDYDLCIVFSTQHKNANKVIRSDQVSKIIDSICVARVGNTIEELNERRQLHPVYGLPNHPLEDMTRKELHELLYEVFLRTLKHIGALYRIDDGMDKKHNQFISLRLSESGCKSIAQYIKYPLQVSRDAVKYPEFRSDPNFYPPYIPYDNATESGQHLNPNPEKVVYERFDRLSRRLKVSESSVGEVANSREVSLFRDTDRLRLLKAGLGEFMNLELMVEHEVVATYYCLKQVCLEQRLQKCWATLRPSVVLSLWQPLDDIRSYYGEEIALYFAWMGFYMRMSIVPGIVGLIVAGLGVAYNRKMDFKNEWVNLSRLIYCVFIALWNVLSLALWQRKEKLLCARWGQDVMAAAACSGLREENPKFKHSGYVVDAAAPAHYVRWFSPCKRRTRVFIATAVTIGSVVCFTVFVNEDLLDVLAKLVGLTKDTSGDFPPPSAPTSGKHAHAEGYWGMEDWLTWAVPSNHVAEHVALLVTLTTVVLKAYNMVFKKLVLGKLVQFENHQYVADHIASINTKLFTVQMVTYLSVLSYIAFFKEFYNPCPETSDGRCLPRLRKQLLNFYYLDLAMIASEIGMPLLKFFMRKISAVTEGGGNKRKKGALGDEQKTRLLSGGPNYRAGGSGGGGKCCDLYAIAMDAHGVPRSQMESYLQEYTGPGGISAEYMEKVTQYTYTTLFSMACPILPALGLLVNLIELRTDAFKLTAVFRRPFPRAVQPTGGHGAGFLLAGGGEGGRSGIGLWNEIQKTMVFLGILSNVMLCMFATVGHDRPLTEKLLGALILLLIGIALKDFIEYKFPVEGEDYRILKARMTLVTHETLWYDPRLTIRPK